MQYPRGPLGTMPDLVEPALAPRLELFVETMAGHHVPVEAFADGEIFKIGSHRSNDLVLDDPLVSQFHCRLRAVHGTWQIEDLASFNGTRVDGVRVRDADLPYPFCRIQVGASSVAVHAVGMRDEGEIPLAPSFGAVRGSSLPMRRLFGMLERIADSDATVLIQGESGSGKGMIAAELQQRGPRKDGPLVIVDGGAIASGLAESELFGHARGAFTGASSDRIGAFEAANGGTLFLDEVGELPLDLQPKFLRALESREIRRLGETMTRKVDVRVIAATNRALEVEVNQRRFREDLFFRLSVVNVEVPPLRERVEDIPDLVMAFAQATGVKGAEALFTPAVLADLASHPWPGNVRELRNYVERAVVLRTTTRAKSGTYRIADRLDESTIDLDVPFREAKEAAVETFDRAYLAKLLRWSNGNVSQAARRAGMDRIHLHRLVQRYGLKAAAGRK
ncbi:MAG TPA: sigma 54-interacting transcriptional regulator [Polyangiaceae bacterium]|nr:sigma 54-interacting transcriptional regulator [Polyangiaceae bacterium]